MLSRGETRIEKELWELSGDKHVTREQEKRYRISERARNGYNVSSIHPAAYPGRLKALMVLAATSLEGKGRLCWWLTRGQQKTLPQEHIDRPLSGINTSHFALVLHAPLFHKTASKLCSRYPIGPISIALDSN